MAKELGWAYYREFYAQHPDRVTVPWTEFDAEYEACGWFSDRRRRLVERAVAQAEDRWEIEDYEGGGGYLRELAGEFHSFYNAERVLVDERAEREARIALIAATRQVLANGLAIIGVSAPVKM